MIADPTDHSHQAPPLTREQVFRHQRQALAERLFDLEADVALLQQEVALRDRRIAELEAAASAMAGMVELTMGQEKLRC